MTAAVFDGRVVLSDEELAAGGVPLSARVSPGGQPGQPVPEPGTLLLVGSGLVGVALAGRSRRRRV